MYRYGVTTMRPSPLTLLLAAVLLASAAGAQVCPPAPECRPAGSVRRAGKYSLINPLLEVEPSLEFSELRPFKYKVEELISVHRSSGDASHVSVYFRDLMNGPLFGINEKEPFTPASLLKVPVMLAVFKHAEDEPDFLQRQVRYDSPPDAAPDIATTTLRTGSYYTVEDLLRSMIVNSDNGAVFLLRAMTGPDALEEVYTDLGIEIPSVRTADEPISVREYGTFFRMLYNASYLSRAHSQKALELLAASDYAGGLVAGIPKGVRVAHKFGERSTPGDDKRQLHDCGIVYYPARPYILCVMTRGRDFPRMSAVIADISRAVYSEVSSGSLKP